MVMQLKRSNENVEKNDSNSFHSTVHACGAFGGFVVNPIFF